MVRFSVRVSFTVGVIKVAILSCNCEATYICRNNLSQCGELGLYYPYYN